MSFSRRALLVILGTSFALAATAQTNPSAADKPGSAPAVTKPAPKTPTNPVNLTADGLGAKAHLEELLARRYADELSTIVERASFTISAQLDLVEVAPKVAETPAAETKPDTSLPFDLQIGTIDPDELLRRYADDPVAQAKISGFLSAYRIRKVTMTVGLSADTGTEIKTLVDTWLKNRTELEFGTAGVGSVSFVQKQKKELLDRLIDFQELAGQALVASAILLGALMWAFSQKRSSGETAITKQAAPEAGTEQAAGADAASENDTLNSEAEELRIRHEIASFSQKLADLGQSLSSDKDAVIRSWCEEGEAGKLKLACFAEAAGKSVGRLPIPSDSVADLSKIFSAMPEMIPAEKLAHLSKAYWDLVKAVNLGTDTLHRPFGYLTNINLESVGLALVEQNVKMKALVSVHMPTQLRQSFLQSLDSDTKKSLLQEAANLGSIPAAEYREMESSFKARLSGDTAEDVIAFDAALEKMAEALSPIEEISVMSGIQGPSAERYRKTVPSLAFLDRWPDDKLGSLLSSAMPNELVAYLRLRPEQESRIIALSPPMAGAVAQDELTRPDSVSDDDKNRTLSTLRERMRTLVEQGEVNLQNIFTTSSAPDDTGGSDGQQSAA